MDKFFKISERGSTLRAEIVGGITTFFAMAYIIFVNPDMLSVAIGEEMRTPLLVATCASAAIGCILTAMLANVPFAQAPGMGLNAFFTYTVCLGMGYTWQEALAIVLLSGIIFLVIAISPLRSKIIESIPAFMKSAISAGIGLFIAFIGLLNVNLISFGSGVPALNFAGNNAGLLTLIGLLITAILMAYNVKGAIVLGILATTVIGFPMGQTMLPESITMEGVTLAPLLFKLDIGGAFAKGILPLITAVISFAMVDCFDTVGTLIGTATNAGLTDRRGNLPGGDRALIADAIATCTGAVFGTSTVTTFVESSTGIAAGARTGLSSLVVGFMFLVSCFFAPIAGIVPSAATAPALIIVGVFMLKSAAEIAWDDLEISIPCFMTIITMPFAYSIGDGIGMGFIFYSLIKIARGKAKEVPVLIYVLSAAFAAMFALTYL